jgi:hypothetical protein
MILVWTDHPCLRVGRYRFNIVFEHYHKMVKLPTLGLILMLHHGI